MTKAARKFSIGDVVTITSPKVAELHPFHTAVVTDLPTAKNGAAYTVAVTARTSNPTHYGAHEYLEFESRHQSKFLQPLAEGEEQIVKPAPQPEPAADKPKAKRYARKDGRRANTPKQKAENFMADHGVTFEDKTDSEFIHYVATAPADATWNGADGLTGELEVRFPRAEGHKQVGWTLLWADMRHGITAN